MLRDLGTLDIWVMESLPILTSSVLQWLSGATWKGFSRARNIRLFG